MLKIKPTELLVIQIIIYFSLWLWYEYLATLLSVIWGSIFFVVLLISLAVEWIEKSKVPKSYYKFLLVSVLAPILAAVMYSVTVGGIQWFAVE